jgi:hypothetical protein
MQVAEVRGPAERHCARRPRGQTLLGVLLAKLLLQSHPIRRVIQLTLGLVDAMRVSLVHLEAEENSALAHASDFLFFGI